jgi:hypothetical protein
MIECIRFRAHEKGHMKGFADFFFPKWGIEIYGCTLYEKDGKRWVNLPTKETEIDGEKKFFPFIRFKEKRHWEVFIEQAKKAIDDFREKEIMKEEAPIQKLEEKQEFPF